MTTPDPRRSMPRSSFAVAMRDYTFVRPGIANTITTAILVVARIFGVDLIGALREAATTIEQGARVTRALHRYHAGIGGVAAAVHQHRPRLPPSGGARATRQHSLDAPSPTHDARTSA